MKSLPRGTRYLPELDNRVLKERSALKSLYAIADLFQLLDRIFATFIRAAMLWFEEIAEAVHSIHQDMARHFDTAGQCEGGLNSYCRKLAEQKLSGQVLEPEMLLVVHTGLDALTYLRNTQEAPCWYLVLDILIATTRQGERRGNTQTEVIQRAARDVKREVKHHLHVVTTRDPDAVPQDLKYGIEPRIFILERLDDEIPRFCYLDDVTGTLSCKRTLSITSVGVLEADNPSNLQNVTVISLMIVSMACGLVPACIGFAGFYNPQLSVFPGPSEDGKGSSSDPDYMWLIASTVRAVFGNLFSVAPLFRHTSVSVSRATSGFIMVSMALGTVSVASYPFLNKAWSSFFSFCCTLFALGAVFILTQNTVADISIYMSRSMSSSGGKDIAAKDASMSLISHEA
ncbi:hypothetical protein PG993_010987 [Apiospora rasikravindrae]|uniref:Uncharacterized protein n=1 Tax=Apiospora rasikravindrae TaxID=990691 RepID=A0ABR1SCV3_9PEZI